jgi:xanthine dehydrogenase accessory factor
VAFVPLIARCRLVLIGAGHIAQAVAELAAKLEFDVWVIDDRSEFACSERFPAAKRIVVDEIGSATRALQTDARTYCVVVTRGHRHDEQALLNLVGRPLGYLGMIGSKRKVRLIFEDLRAAGVEPELLEQVHAPIGLDIGAHSVAEIAIAIVAELIEHRNVGHEACLRRRRALECCD